ncbi:MAG: hypothetical protein ABEJ05_00895 [Haloglomus sp.]
MNPGTQGRIVLLVVPLFLISVGVAAAAAVGTPVTEFVPGVAAMVLVGGAMYYFAGQIIALGEPPEE